MLGLKLRHLKSILILPGLILRYNISLHNLVEFLELLLVVDDIVSVSLMLVHVF